MTIEQLITVIIEKGVSVVLSVIVIYAVIQLIRHAPALTNRFFDLIQNNTIATSNSTRVMEEAKATFNDTREMHNIMDAKIHKMQEEISDIRQILERNDEADKEFQQILLDKINSLKEEIEVLKELKCEVR